MLKDCVRDLNFLLRNEPAMYENQFNIYGFEWVDLNHPAECVVVYRRKGKDPVNDLLIILNLTPVVRHDWKVYTYGKSEWREVFNSDDKRYWGTGNVFNPEIHTRSLDKNDNMYEINVHLPPLGAIVLK
jgi:1,4-alpha-glucan branching enzyme